MKLCFKFLFFIFTTCFMMIYPVRSVRIGPYPSEAEVTAALPSLSSDSSDLSSEAAGSSGQGTSELDETPTLGNIGTYGENTVVSCTMGLLTYYNQADPRWADFLYGPSDPMRSHGCGPAALAMIVTSYTGTVLTPPEAAQWASDHGYCIRGEGSRHALIPDGLTQYGLSVTPLVDRSVESVLNQIRSGHLVVALMDKGFFTNGGHFLLLTEVLDDGTIKIADPASWENTSKAWDPVFILSQIRTRAEAGGPLWSVEMPPEE